MQPRLKRYKQFIESQYLEGLKRNREYFADLKPELAEKIRNGQFKRILFTGMGCSAIVSDTIKGFFAEQKIPIYIEVINDYEIEYLTDTESLKDGRTLAIVSSYSGHSQEPINVYERIKKLTKNIMFLTSGGRLAEIAKKDGVSIAYWKFSDPDREYPLFHIPQFFSTILDIFYRFGLLKSNYERELSETADNIRKEFDEDKIKQVEAVADNLRDKDIILIASPKWYVTLLKLAKMHINEMAMAPAYRNYIHEFGHSEIAAFSDPKKKFTLLIFRDKDEDDYLKQKIDGFISILSERIPQNKNITVVPIDIRQKTFLEQFFSTLNFVQYLSYFLGVHYDCVSRELISRASNNFWYNIETIKKDETLKSKKDYI